MKAFALVAIVASLCGALAGTAPPITQKDVLLMQHLQQMRNTPDHSHLSDKDAQTLDGIVRNWQRYRAGEPNDFDMRLVDAFVNDTPALDARTGHGKRHTIFTHSERPGKARVTRGVPASNREGEGAQGAKQERHQVRDNPYMDGERFPLRRRGEDARTESTHGRMRGGGWEKRGDGQVMDGGVNVDEC